MNYNNTTNYVYNSDNRCYIYRVRDDVDSCNADFILVHACLVLTTMLLLITFLVRTVTRRRKSHLDTKMVTEGLTPPFRIIRRRQARDSNSNSNSISNSNSNSNWDLRRPFATTEVVVGQSSESCLPLCSTDSDSMVGAARYIYREYTMEIEFVNALGNTVVRTYPDIRMPNNAVRWTGGNDNDDDDNNGIVVYHHPDYPQSAYLDYGWGTINANAASNDDPSMVEHNYSYELCCYSSFGMLLVIYWWVAISSTYANIYFWDGIFWQSIFQAAAWPLTIWYAESSIGAHYMAYEDDILRNNIQIPKEELLRPLVLGSLD